MLLKVLSVVVPLILKDLADGKISKDEGLELVGALVSLFGGK